MTVFYVANRPNMSRLPSRRAAVVGLLALVLVGCGSESGTGLKSQGPLPPGYVAPPSTEHLSLVAHPEYVNWRRFPVGMVVVRKKEVSNESGTVRVTTKLRLAEKTAAKVVVESQITVDRPGQPLAQKPPFHVDFPATFRLPEGMQLAQFALPSLKAKPAGEEVRPACGQDYQTQLFTWEEANEGAPLTVKLWRSDDIPGRLLRQEITGPNHDSVEEVVEIIRPVEEALHEKERAHHRIIMLR
jgi:hypothetical protein